MKESSVSLSWYIRYCNTNGRVTLPKWCIFMFDMQMTRIVLPQMLERNKGAIISISSLSGALPAPLLTVYSGCKVFIRITLFARFCPILPNPNSPNPSLPNLDPNPIPNPISIPNPIPNPKHTVTLKLTVNVTLSLIYLVWVFTARC